MVENLKEKDGTFYTWTYNAGYTPLSIRGSGSKSGERSLIEYNLSEINALSLSIPAWLVIAFGIQLYMEVTIKLF